MWCPLWVSHVFVFKSVHPEDQSGIRFRIPLPFDRTAGLAGAGAPKKGRRLKKHMLEGKKEGTELNSVVGRGEQNHRLLVYVV